MQELSINFTPSMSIETDFDLNLAMIVSNLDLKIFRIIEIKTDNLICNRKNRVI